MAALAHWTLNLLYLRTQELISHHLGQHPLVGGNRGSLETRGLKHPHHVHPQAEVPACSHDYIDAWQHVGISCLHLDGYLCRLLLHRQPWCRPFLQSFPRNLLPHCLPRDECARDASRDNDWRSFRVSKVCFMLSRDHQTLSLGTKLGSASQTKGIQLPSRMYRTDDARQFLVWPS
jgi:hypothetical protein